MLAALYFNLLQEAIRSVWVTLPRGFFAWLFIGLIAGWLAGKIVRGTGFGLIADICIGIVGALSRSC